MNKEIPLIARYCPDAPLIVRRDGFVFQSDFLADVFSLSKRLPDTRYLINLCIDRYYFAVVFCASLCKGMINILPQNRQPQIINDLRARYKGSCLAIDSQEMPLHSDAIDVPTLLVRNAPVEPPPLPLISQAAIAAITFTSGSTGQPIAIEKPFATLAKTAHLLSKRFKEENDPPPIIVGTVPTQHMYGLEMTLMMALQGGGVMAGTCPFYPSDIAESLQRLQRHGPLFLVTTPFHLRAVLNAGIGMPSIAKVISATAPLSREVAAGIEQLFCAPVEEIYGCTEAGSMATRRTIIEDIWTLLDGMQIVQHLHTVGISGPPLDGEVILQDRLEPLDKTTFRFIGRAADTINVAGKRSSLSDLTHKLLELEGVEDAVVFMTDESEGARPAALVVSNRSERSILAALAQKIDPVFLPRPLRRTPSIPRNETGKPPLSLLQTFIKQNNDAPHGHQEVTARTRGK